MCDLCCCDCLTCPKAKTSFILSKYNGISSSTRLLLRKLDPLTLIALKFLPPNLIKQNKNPSLSDDISTEETDLGWKKIGTEFTAWKKTSEVELIKKVVSPKFSLYILDSDDFFGDYTWIDKLSGKGLTSTLLFPMKDEIFYFKSEEECNLFLFDTELLEGLALPESYNSNFDMLSDESFSRIFFYSLCAPLVASQKPNDPAARLDLGPFVVDMPLQDLKVRHGFRPYGARIHFSQDQKVTAIFDYFKEKMYRPGDKGWNEAKLLAKVTSFTLVTAREHLIWSHLTLANTFTKISTLTLKPSHPLRRLLTVFTFRTTEINLSAMNALTSKSGLLHRALGFTYKGMQNVFDMSYEQCTIYQPFPERELAPEIQKLAADGKFPYVTEGIAFWKIIKKFVQKWANASGPAFYDRASMYFYETVRNTSKDQAYVIPQYSSSEDMINLITQFIFTVTAYHELVGGVVDFIKLPSRTGFRLAEDHSGNQIDVQSFILALLIGATTAIRMPQLVSKFQNFFGVGGAPEWEREIWDEFIADLEAHSKVVKMADAKRSVEFKYFDPERLECSISV